MYRRSRPLKEKALRIRARHVLADQGAKTTAPFSPEQLAAFEKQVHGTVVVPGDPDYGTARQVFFRQFQYFPQIIVYCECASDVAACLALAREVGLQIVCRSGGHSSGGFSVNNSMVVDLSRMNSVWVDTVGKRAIVGGGTSFHRLNAALADHGLHVPGGACDDVCIGGYMQGGGYGFTSREFGMNCDCVISFEMMLWNGGIVTANASTNPDLYWSVRGGMGSNFGVLLSVTYALVELGELYGFGLSWAAKDAPAALVTLQSDYIHGTATRNLGHQWAVMIQDGSPRLYMRAMFNGSEAACKALIKPLTDLPGTSFDIEMTGRYVRLNQELLEQPVPIPNAPDAAFEVMQSGYIARTLDRAEWAAMMEFMATSPNAWNDIGIEPYGGAIQRHDDPNAFIHRDVSMNWFLEAFWLTPEEQEVNIAWLDRFMALMAPCMNGQSYQNYPRRGMHDPQQAYWAGYLETLEKVKAKYNPFDWFANPQRIGPPQSGGPSPMGPKFPDQPIVYSRPPLATA